MSLEVIGELARHVSDRPLLLIGDYRADEFPAGTIHREWRARLLSQRLAEEIRLRRFNLDETGIATSLILGGDLPAPSDVVEAVHERTNGIPLHIEELLAALDDDARADGRRIRDAHVPDTIGDAVLARLARLSDDARTLARAGAVIGRCFSPDVIAGILDRPLASVEPTIQELVDNSILYPFDYIDEGYFDFRHQLLRDAIYGAVPPSEQRRFHAQAAEFVMALEASSIVHASRHYERAGLRPQAYRASLTGAREASRISARQEAFELYARAIANMPGDLPVDEQADLYSQYAQAAAAIEYNDEAADAAARARELYLEAGRPIEAAEMLTLVGMRDSRGGAPRETYSAYTEQALRRGQRVAAIRGARSLARVPHQRPRQRPAPGLRPGRRPRGCDRGPGPRRVRRRSRDGPRVRPHPCPDRHRRRPLRDRAERRHAGGARGARRRLRVGRGDRLSQPRDHGRPGHGSPAPRRSPSPRATSTPTRSSSRTAAR